MSITAELVQVLVELIDRRTALCAQTTADDVWKKLDRFSSNYIGETKVSCLIMRSLSENRLKFPSLPQGNASATSIDLREDLSKSLAPLSSEEIVRVTRALLVTFVNQITVLIGPTLSTRIVYNVASTKY